MSLSIVCNSNVATPNVMAGLIYVTKPSDFRVLIDDKQCEKKLIISQANPKHKKNNIYLSVDTMQKMIQRFLTEKKMSEAKLAKILAIKVGDIDRIFSHGNLSRLIPKINLPLIKIYCKTKWI